VVFELMVVVELALDLIGTARVVFTYI